MFYFPILYLENIFAFTCLYDPRFRGRKNVSRILKSITSKTVEGYCLDLT